VQAKRLDVQGREGKELEAVAAVQVSAIVQETAVTGIGSLQNAVQLWSSYW